MPADLWTESVDLAAESGEFPRLRAFVERVCGKGGCDALQIARTLLVMEELFTNTVKYGHSGNGSAAVSVSIQAVTDRMLAVCYEDTAPRHDPFANAPHMEDLLASLTHRRVGGLGVVIIQQLGNDVRYEWSDGRNRVLFKVAVG